MKLPIRKRLLVLTLACAAAQSAQAQSTAPADVSATSPTPAEILRRADQLTNIRAAGSTPFHLKAHFVAMDPVGFTGFTGEGDYEETWLAPDKWIQEIHFGPYHSIETREGTRHSLEANQSYRPKRVLQTVGLLTDKKVREYDPSFPWTVEVDKTSGVIQLLPPSGPPLRFLPDGLPVQDGQDHALGYEEFSGKRVAHIFQEDSAVGEPLLKIKVTQLDALPASAVLPEVSLPGAVVSGDPGPFFVSKDSMTAPKLIYAPDPEYPAALGKKHVEGVVVVSLAVDTKGAAREAEATSATDSLFIPATIKAVSDYKFEPARHHGTPVQVQVNVEVHFRVH